MWIVRLALRRPYTFVVVSVLICLLGIAGIVTTPKDIFPYIDIPVVSIVWTYPGLTPEDMSNRVVIVSERALTTTVNNIEHIESQSFYGVAVVKVYFQPTVKIDLAIAQITSVMQTILRILPPGIFPPNIVKYDASSVPIVQLGLSGKGLTEQALYDLGLNFIRPRLATVEGASVPPPYGGKTPQVMVDLDTNALMSKHLSATDVSNALNAQNLILPAGTARVGDREFLVQLNSSPPDIKGMNDLPIRAAGGALVYMKDVAQVRNGYAVQTNIVRVNGKASALLTVLKNGEASTLDIVKGVISAIPQVEAGLASGLKITPFFDQSEFVRESISEVLREATIAAALTALMILLFLGSWRSTLIVCVSIPLSILVSIIVLSALHQTINVMTLGGLALAVGILVDDATVELENTHRNLGERKPLVRAILDSAQQVATPAFVSTLAICIVFTPVVLLTGAARFLFTPLAMAVVFAMLASYFLSRTLVPTMMHFLLPAEVQLYQDPTASSPNIIWRIHMRFDHAFERMRDGYKDLLEFALRRRTIVLVSFGVFVVGSLFLLPLIGEDFFPYVDSGQMRLHVLPPEGTRIEDSAQEFARIEAEIRRVLPDNEVGLIIDNIGLPTVGINLAYGDNATVSNSDGDILIALRPGQKNTLKYTRLLREDLQRQFPTDQFFFLSANITNQILNFGLPAPIDVQVIGRDQKSNYQVALALEQQMRAVPGAVDVHIRQQVSYPKLQVDVDRARAEQLGLTQRDVANSMLISLSGSGQTAPNEWLNPNNNVNYQVVVQTPIRRNDTFAALGRTPITSPSGNSTQLLDNLVHVHRATAPIVVDHYAVQPVFDIFANVDRRDLGGVANGINTLIGAARKHLKPGSQIVLRGQAQTMQESFFRLGLGILFAMALIYLLMAVNFQSWTDPLIILMALPGAFCGIVWMLFLTHTTLSVPSLMGTIMTIGVATANSILLVVFANDERSTGLTAIESALSAGYLRLRPVCMTALAMITGMFPMATAFGKGGEQNAPLGRAVIGGLLVATITTLFIVPLIYTLLRRRPPVNWEERIDLEYAGRESESENGGRDDK